MNTKKLDRLISAQKIAVDMRANGSLLGFNVGRIQFDLATLENICANCGLTTVTTNRESILFPLKITAIYRDVELYAITSVDEYERVRKSQL